MIMEAVDVWQKVHGHLERFVLSRVKNPAMTDDILQEIYVKLQTKLPQLRQRDKVTGWLYQIARNTIAEQLRDRQRQLKLADRANLPPRPADAARDLTAEFASCIPAMLQVLPPIYREALFLSEIEELSQKEVAEKLGIPYPTAKSRIRRGKEKLRETLLQCCHISTDVYGNVIDYRKR